MTQPGRRQLVGSSPIKLKNKNLIKWAIDRAALFVALSVICFAGLTGCASAAANSPNAAAKKAWSNDQYVSPEGDAGTQANAARILNSPDKVCDRVMQVGSACAQVHENPTVNSPVIGTLAANDAVRVVAEGQFCRKTGTSDMDEFAASGDTTPTWVKITSGKVSGWVPARSLFDPEKLALSSMSVADMRDASGSAGKGFSEKAKSNYTVMKGAAGTPVLKDANYPAADKIIATCSTPLPYATLSKDAFTATPTVTSAVNLGTPLSTLDPALAAKASAATAKAVQPPIISAQLEQAAGMMSMIGVKVDKDTQDKAKLAAAVADLLLEMTKESPLTPVEERILGYECLAHCIGKDTVLPPTNPISIYVNWMGTKIAANSSMPYPSIGYTFVVVQDDKTINAMAMPGGPIIITTGMLKFLESESELATILGHEIAHVEERHGMKAAEYASSRHLAKVLRFVKNSSLVDKSIADALAPVVKDLPESVRYQAVSMCQKQIASMFEQDYLKAMTATVENIRNGSSPINECAADLRGMSLARAAGWNPVALQPVLARLKATKGNYGRALSYELRADQAKEVVIFLPPLGAESTEVLTRWKKLESFLSN